MTQRPGSEARYTVPLEDLVATARVPREDQVEEHDARGPRDDDPASVRHLPGGVQPYGA